ncbi:hypothetical protein KAFR_0C05190 [Kazachstania africana CBS 2517]|uniref:DNA repair protein REV1 n=1 Tax=Kazachstania africana (strain ATCC 22294 / BCRC 22015 / CBS 2517 / CECT 1963 / NBRC 1671 / NRRL Y-8276) TaxID=1071382 RepID=H2AT10_KAZAF|nr:hypothetical protein KAFR_0C05190 [Kazachstania africana CBS 2517]CCF57510.1 hypothetical protein KAFR_0C05190 [Kazachstania africana CBS 2517]
MVEGSDLLDLLDSSIDDDNNHHRQKTAKSASFLSTLSDDSLIEYINKVSQQLDSTKPQSGSEDERNESVEPQKNYGRDTYFQEKALKQSKEDELLKRRYESIGKATSNLFKDLTVYINGYTRPSRFQLHEMIVLNGGKFLHHLSAKRSVTHIIASTLTLKKKIEFANYKVVKPEWLVDSIKVKKLLPWQDYSIVTSIDQDQLQLTTFLNKDNIQTTNCKDPNFLKEYFAHSRLHHLSNWKAQLRASFLTSFSSNKKKAIDINNINILHVDFDCFFVTVSYLYRDKSKFICDIDRDPIVVCYGTQNSEIASCNYVARSFGIKNGMWVTDAKVLLANSGLSLVALPYKFDEIESTSNKFYEILNNFSKFLLVLPISIDEAICIVEDTHDENFYELCETVREIVFRETGGCTVSVGCANSLVMARLALKKAKPNGYFIVDKELISDDNFWSCFRIDDLPGVGYSTVYKIKENFDSIENLRDLKYNVTLNQLKSKVGIKLSEKIFLALDGKDDDESKKMLLEPEEVFQRKSLSIEINWGIRFDNIAEIDQFLDRCSVYLIEKLIELDKVTSQITLKIMKRAKDAPIEPTKYLGMGKCDGFASTAKLGIPTSETGVIATELKNIYRSLGCPPKELRGVSVQFNKLLDNVGKNQRELDLPFSKLVLKRKIVDSLPDSIRGSINSELKRRKIDVVDNIDIDNPEIRERNKYFKKISPVKKAEQDLFNTSFEKDFINELPTQIKKEITNDLRIKKKIQKTKFGQIKEQIELRKQKEDNINAHFLGSESLLEPIKFQKITNFKVISAMIITWLNETIKNNKGPHEKDVRLFENYLIKLSDSNKTHLVLRITELISVKLNLFANAFGDSAGFQEWDKILVRNVIPILNRNRHTFQTERKLDIEFNI